MANRNEEWRTLAWGGGRWAVGVAVGVGLFVGVWRSQNAVLAKGCIIGTGGLVVSALGRAGRAIAGWREGRKEP